MNVPENLKYAESHEWLREDGTVGITDHAQQELTDVVFVELPKIGAQVEAGAACAVVESVKAASDIYSPASGEVIAVNDALTSNPALVNTDPYGEGWLFRLKVSAENPALKDAAAYSAQIG
jgi:glycine cleavage system H protein